MVQILFFSGLIIDIIFIISIFIELISLCETGEFKFNGKSIVYLGIFGLIGIIMMAIAPIFL